MSRFFPYWAGAALITLATVLMPASAQAGLCADCAGKVFITNVGKCVNCGAPTASGAFELCPACSTQRRKCQACGAALQMPVGTTPKVAAPTADDKDKEANPPAGAETAEKAETAGEAAPAEKAAETRQAGKAAKAGKARK